MMGPRTASHSLPSSPDEPGDPTLPQSGRFLAHPWRLSHSINVIGRHLARPTPELRGWPSC
ncbi:hypothetical protein BN381_390017 [Candidatus Microthrix parvicella RN1]|uniref:Uncharacterized protein n=1 Tax=Candidatus Neomicrothrix parvicella RN1 TaxID=1229780 RepID=R4Z145_9ACTN|nr:hypothetical protein BN381_390017 [Candidatus Microthrix parvicella RN1]